MRIPIAFFFLILSVSAASQYRSKQVNLDWRFDAAPDSAFYSTAAFSSFLEATFPSDKERIAAIYYWIAKSVTYDVENMYNIEFEEEPDDLIEKTFLTRRAICQGYSELFNDLCRKTGIESYVVHGYTRQNERVHKTGHSWVVAFIENDWFSFDPTWGSGYVEEGKFTRSFTWDYFQVTPRHFAHTHFPFDPMWQCLEYPLSVEEFYEGSSSQPEGYPVPFAYSDSISLYVSLPLTEQYGIALRRIQQAGIKNALTRDYATYLMQILENERLQKEYDYKKRESDRFNESVALFNRAAHLFNDYILYFNRQFKPARPDNEIRKMIDTCETTLKQAKRLLRQVDAFDQSMTTSMEQLNRTMATLQKNIDQQKAFVNTYITTPRSYRASLFRRG
jgi:hypothetical protein